MRGRTQRSDGWPAGRHPLGPRQLFVFVFVGTIILSYLPYSLRAGRHIFGGLGTYAGVWEANDSLFGLVRRAGNSHAQSELLMGVAILAVLVSVLKRGRRFANPKHVNRNSRPLLALNAPDVGNHRNFYLLRSTLVLTAGLLLLSPTAFPWYFTWTIPFLCFCPNAPWLLMSITAILGYAPVVAYAVGQPYLHSALILTLEYGPVLVWLAWLAMRRPQTPAGKRGIE